MADTVKMVALRNHTGSYGHVRKGTEFEVSAREARSFARLRSPLAEPVKAKAEKPEPAEVSDLTGTAVDDLEAALAEVTDAAEIRRMAKADKRKTAAAKYQARLDALEG